MNYQEKKTEPKARRSPSEWWSDLPPAGVASIIVFGIGGSVALLIGSIAAFQTMFGDTGGIGMLVAWFVVFAWAFAYSLAKDTH